MPFFKREGHEVTIFSQTIVLMEGLRHPILLKTSLLDLKWQSFKLSEHFFPKAQNA